MYTSRKKIHKDNNAEPTEFEETVAQVCQASIKNLIDVEQSKHWQILKFFDGAAGIGWFGEFQPGFQDWVARSVHQLSSVWIQTTCPFRTLIISIC